MDKQYYRDYFELERKHWWFRVRGGIILERLARILQDRKSIKILNIGVATGRTTELLKVFGDVKSIEFDDDCRNFTAEKLGIEIEQGSITALKFPDESFDLVCAFDVIEHVEDDQQSMNEMQRVCKTNGYICVTVPCFMSLWSHHDVVNHHFRRYTIPELKRLSDEHSANLRYATYFNSLLFLPILLVRKLSNLLGGGNRTSSDSDFSITKVNSLPNKFAELVFQFERILLKLGIRFPFGVSALALWQKIKVRDF